MSTIIIWVTSFYISNISKTLVLVSNKDFTDGNKFFYPELLEFVITKILLFYYILLIKKLNLSFLKNNLSV